MTRSPVLAGLALTVQFLGIIPQTPIGGVAQLGEHLPCKQGVMGSIPIISTSGGHRPRPTVGSEQNPDGEMTKNRWLPK